MTEHEFQYLAKHLRKSKANPQLAEIFIASLKDMSGTARNDYMLAVNIASIAADIVLCLRDDEDLLAFAKYLDKLSKIALQCAQTKAVTNRNNPFKTVPTDTN